MFLSAFTILLTFYAFVDDCGYFTVTSQNPNALGPDLVHHHAVTLMTNSLMKVFYEEPGHMMAL